MSQLIGIDKPSENEYLKCIHCGLCLAVCPTYREQLTETASPRGLLNPGVLLEGTYEN